MILFDQAGAAEHSSKLLSPHLSLRSFVEHFWVQHAPAAGKVQRPWRIVPDAGPHIVVAASCGSRLMENIRCGVVGARSQFADISVMNRTLTLGARLHPGTLPLLTRFPANDFTDRSVGVEEVFGPRGKLLVEQLAGQPSAGKALGVLIKFLYKAFAGRKAPDKSDALPGSSYRASDLAARWGVPNRTLHAKMKEQAGLAPKRLLRVQRLHRVLAVRRRQGIPWAEVSAVCGFADQAHLVREFHDLLGEAPGVWQARRSLADLFKTTPGALH